MPLNARALGTVTVLRLGCAIHPPGPRSMLPASWLGRAIDPLGPAQGPRPPGAWLDCAAVQVTRGELPIRSAPGHGLAATSIHWAPRRRGYRAGLWQATH